MKGELMKTYIAYFDETGDDGVTINSSDHFILTSLYMPAESWQQNFEKMRILRRELKDKYGFHVSEEMHTKHFLTDKNPYREYHWSKETKQDIIKAFTLTIAKMDLKIVNVIIDKKKFKLLNASSVIRTDEILFLAAYFRLFNVFYVKSLNKK